jgi:GNAT superfamily N-acetyltransferase
MSRWCTADRTLHSRRGRSPGRGTVGAVDPAHPAGLTVESLADRPDLVEPLARIRWREWGADDPRRDGLPRWIEDTRAEAGRDGVPVTCVACDAAGRPVGGVGLVAVEYPELADRGPWVVGTIVRPDVRDRGIGAVLIARLLRWAQGAGFGAVRVATGGRAVRFYQRCGFSLEEVVSLPGREPLTILVAPLPAAVTPPQGGPGRVPVRS